MSHRAVARGVVRLLRTTTSLLPSATRRPLLLTLSQATQAIFTPNAPVVRWLSSEGEKQKDGQDETREPEQAEEEDKDSAVKEEEEATTAKFEARVKALTDQHKDQLLRSLAEQENTRRIALRDVDSARQFAIKSFAKSLLDVSDNLSRALDAVPEDMRADKDGHSVLATLYEGIQMTDRELTKAFELNGLVKYGQPGDIFDPNLHEALYEYADPVKEPGTVGQVMTPGFMLNKRVLRPAEVGVVKNQP
jgi:molecular chaperone GrpE